MRRIRVAEGAIVALVTVAVMVIAAGGLALASWNGGHRAGGPGAGERSAPGTGPGSQPSALAGTARPSPPSASQPSARPASPPAQPTLASASSVPLSALPAGTRVVTLAVVNGTSSLSVNVAPLGGTLAQASPPVGGQGGATLGLAVGPGGRSRSGQGNQGGAVVIVSVAPAGPAVSLTLSPAVAWRLEFDGGTSGTDVDMTGGHVAALDVFAGSSAVSVALPRPQGTLVLTLDGGAGRLAVTVPAGVPARVIAGGGAGQVTLGGTTWNGVAGGTVITQPGWAAAAARLDVDATAGVSQVTVAQR